MNTLNLRVASESFSADANGSVLDNSTLGVRSTNARSLDARIDASLFNASLGGLTVRINFALWLDNRFDDSRPRLAANEWIACVSVGAGADGIVPDHLASSVNSASSRARVFTFLSNACVVVGTV